MKDAELSVVAITAATDAAKWYWAMRLMRGAVVTAWGLNGRRVTHAQHQEDRCQPS